MSSFTAGGEGFEPPSTDSESGVLPLDEPPTVLDLLNLTKYLHDWQDRL